MRQTSGVPRPETESRDAWERRLWPRAVSRVEALQFRRIPLLAAALCFALGESLTRLPAPTFRPTFLLLFAVLALSALTLLALRRTLRLALLPLAGLWIAAGLWSAQIAPSPPPQTAVLTYADGLSRTVEGRIVRIRTLPPRSANPDGDTDPSQWDQPGNPTLSIDLALTAIEDVTPDTSRMVPIAGGIRATVYADSGPVTSLPSQLRCGASIEAPMRLRIPERYRDPGAWQYADYLLGQGIAATASLPAAKLHLLANPAPLPLARNIQCHIFAAQAWASSRLLDYVRSTPNRHLPAVLRLSPDDAGMLNAMLFGDRSRLTRTLRLGFERTGSFHLFVVSGMHVALLAGALFWLFRRLRLGARGPKLNEWLATLLTLTVSFAYALLTGFGVPIQRALAMTAIFLAARLIFRERNTLNAVGAAALAILVWSPGALFDSSFQMTFLALVAIAGIALPLGERSFLPYARAAKNLRDLWRDPALPPRLAHFRVMLRLWGEACAAVVGSGQGSRAYALPATIVRILLWAGELCLVGLIAESVMVLPMAVYFHRATLFALPANLISIPLVAVLAPLGVATFCSSLLSSWLAALPGAATALMLHGITFAIASVSRAKAADLRVPGPRLLPALAALACIAFCCWAVRRSRAYVLAGLAALPLAAVLSLWPEPPAVHPNRLEVTAIDVGQGDSLLVVGPTGKTMLIDAGGPTGAAANAENDSSTDAFDVGEEVVSPYLWSRQFRRLDVVALTHAHSDHMGGMPAILRNFRPRELWVSIDPNSAAYRSLLAEAASLGIRVRHMHAGDDFVWNSVAISVLAPAVGYVNHGPPVNNDSLVMRLRFGRASALLEGDAEAPSERGMVARSLTDSGAALGPDTLLKVGHHGSHTSTTPEFLALVHPRDAVISVGLRNSFGHPSPQTIGRLAAAHIHTYRTDEFGLTTFLLSRDGRISASTGASNP